MQFQRTNDGYKHYVLMSSLIIVGIQTVDTIRKPTCLNIMPKKRIAEESHIGLSCSLLLLVWIFDDLMMLF